jgi:hypothetical protein
MLEQLLKDFEGKTNYEELQEIINPIITEIKSSNTYHDINVILQHVNGNRYLNENYTKLCSKLAKDEKLLNDLKNIYLIDIATQLNSITDKIKNQIRVEGTKEIFMPKPTQYHSIPEAEYFIPKDFYTKTYWLKDTLSKHSKVIINPTITGCDTLIISSDIEYIAENAFRQFSFKTLIFEERDTKLSIYDSAFSQISKIINFVDIQGLSDKIEFNISEILKKKIDEENNKKITNKIYKNSPHYRAFDSMYLTNDTNEYIQKHYSNSEYIHNSNLCESSLLSSVKLFN